MVDITPKVGLTNPSDIARETLRRLALRKIVPTPENYRDLYHEIAGTATAPGAVNALEALTDELRQRHPALSPYLNEMDTAIQSANWSQFTKVLLGLTEQSRPVQSPGTDECSHLSGSYARLQALFSQTLLQALAPRLEAYPALAGETRRLASEVQAASTDSLLAKVSQHAQRLWVDIEMQTAGSQDQQEGLRGLLKLLVDNIGELTNSDNWLSGQMKMIKEVIQGPIQPQTYAEAEKQLKEVIYRQGVVKQSMREADLTLKSTVKRFIDKLGEAVETTGDYHDTISQAAQRISRTEDVTNLNGILEHILHETRLAQDRTSRTREDLVKTQETARDAEKRIADLETELARMSTLVRIDPMTHSLNRRGMEHEFQKEAARSDRHGSPLCVAMIDIDNFKKLNDTYGHMTGDEVLIHLVQVAKEELRVTDAIGRMGGEEFLILLPNTRLDDAVNTVARVQRGLTKRLFMNNNDRILITFSAGVALREPGEGQESVMDRADKGLYEAKRTGKNKVCPAPRLPPTEDSLVA
ncbi:MAG: GGDEF domain-containing protein [Thiobacillaceae bacterium]